MYVIVEVPAPTPVTTPVPATTVALKVLLLLHVPPPVALARVTVDPTATVVNPVIVFTAAFTDTTRLEAQPGLAV
jgi:hypothetical protein